MKPLLFDHRLRAVRRDRAVRKGVETFLFDRAFDECIERLGEIRKSFGRALMAGCPNSAWRTRLEAIAAQVEVVDPGREMASRAGGECADLEALPFAPARFDLCLTVGLLDTANDLTLAAAEFRRILKPDGLLIGAIAGGQSLPRLRAAMLAADMLEGHVSPHVHPRIEAPSLGRLLSDAGFSMPVIDIDRVELTYHSFDALVTDLRAIGATNILNSRSRRPVLRKSVDAARTAFLDGQSKAAELIEILHFAAWASPELLQQTRR